MNSRFIAALVGVAFWVVVALIGPAVTSTSPERMDFRARLSGPTTTHPLGTDQFGRDVWVRIVYGARPALGLSLAGVMLGGGIGVIVAVAGWIGGRWSDEVVMRLTDALMAFPGILAALLTAAIVGPGVASVLSALAVANVPAFARLTRVELLRWQQETFVEAARALGMTESQVLWRHLVPNTAPILIVQVATALAQAVLIESALSYLGLGLQPPYPTWGRMLREAQSFVAMSPYPALFPGLAILTLVLALNGLSDELRERLDPRRRARRAG